MCLFSFSLTFPLHHSLAHQSFLPSLHHHIFPSLLPAVQMLKVMTLLIECLHKAWGCGHTNTTSTTIVGRVPTHTRCRRQGNVLLFHRRFAHFFASFHVHTLMHQTRNRQPRFVFGLRQMTHSLGSFSYVFRNLSIK